MKELKYSINAQELSGKYTLSSPELSLSVDGKDLNKCYAEIKERIAEKQGLFEKIGINISFESLQARPKSNLKSFTKKWISLFLALLAILTFLTISLNILFTQVFNHRYLRLERKILETITPTEIKQQKRIKRFKENMQVISPYIRETKALINIQPNKASNE